MRDTMIRVSIESITGISAIALSSDEMAIGIAANNLDEIAMFVSTEDALAIADIFRNGAYKIESAVERYARLFPSE